MVEKRFCKTDNIRDAFLWMLMEERVAEKLEIEKNQVKLLRNRALKGKITSDKMNALLVKFGFEIRTQCIWEESNV